VWLGGRIWNIYASTFSLLGLLVGDSSTSTVTLHEQLLVGVGISGLVSWVDWALYWSSNSFIFELFATSLMLHGDVNSCPPISFCAMVMSFQFGILFSNFAACFVLLRFGCYQFGSCTSLRLGSFSVYLQFESQQCAAATEY
jgi:hypothetical protein